MGWMPFSRSSAAASADDGKTIEAAAASTSTKTIAAAELPAKELKTSNLKAKAVEKPTLTEAEQLDLLVGGARLDDTAAKDKASFLGSNTRHMYLDAFLSCAVYTFSGLQHIQGQSNALTLLTMWTVGTTFLVDAGERKFLQEALQGTLPNMQKAMNGDASTGQGQQTPTEQSVDGSTANASGVQNAESVTLSSAMAAAPLDAAKLAEQQRKIFMTPTVASWVWMLASFQQFKVHKRLKWCGYSSWMGLGCVSYYTTRHMYNLLVE